MSLPSFPATNILHHFYCPSFRAIALKKHCLYNCLWQQHGSNSEAAKWDSLCYPSRLPQQCPKLIYSAVIVMV
jgi:hypothetical protein